MQSRIEEQVMASVAVIHTGRKLVSRVAVELYVLAASAIALWQLTWVHRVFANLTAVEHGGAGATAHYLQYAFLHTHLPVQIATAAAAVALVAFIVDTTRTLLTPQTTLYSLQ